MTNYSLDEDERQREKEVMYPEHYHNSDLGIQPLEYILANNLDFLEGNIVKYVTRYLNKDGIEDLIKAQRYLDKLIERERT
jgi:hypothetical protein